jgi:transposase
MRLTLVRERATVSNRLHKALEGANIKLGAVASDILGASGRKILRALVTQPDASPSYLAGLALGKLREKRDDLTEALEGRMNDHHRFIIEQLLDHTEELDRRIETFEARIEALSAPFRKAVDLVDTIPAVSRVAANAIVSETGADMTRFPTAGHLASWLGLCPGNNESGGKRLSGRTRKGNRYARANLVQVAHVASRMPETQYHALYHRIASRRGKKRALVAVAHAIVVTIHHLLSRCVAYEEPGPDYLAKRDPGRQVREVRYLMARASKMGLMLVPEQIAA